MQPPGYLQQSLVDCNPEVRAQIALVIAEKQSRQAFLLGLWLKLESGSTTLVVIATLLILTIGSYNDRTTQWYESLKIFGVSVPRFNAPKVQPEFKVEGKPLQVGDVVAAHPITSGFGQRVHPVYGTPGSFHNGVDAATPSGTPVIAPWDGTVEPVENDRCGWGLRYYSKSMPRNRVGLCHLSSRVQAGTVKAGQPIGRSGGQPGQPGAGSSTGPHLHFALFDQGGNAVQPTRGVVEKFLSPKSANVQPTAGVVEKFLSPKSDQKSSQVTNYFLEVALGAEFSQSSSAPRIRKWQGDVRIQPMGNPTEQDLNTLRSVVRELNELTDREIRLTIVNQTPNVTIHFAPESRFSQLEPNYQPGNYGYFWTQWDRSNRIYQANVLITTTKVTQKERSHLLREELTQALGLMRDSNQYRDSIFYQPWTAVQQYSAIDKALIKTLYRPDIKPGMTREEVKGVLN